MNYKTLFDRILKIISSPASEWMSIKNEKESENVLTSYVYPLLGFCAVALFIGTLFGHGFDKFYLQTALTKCCAMIVSLFGGYFLSTYLIGLYGKHVAKLPQEYHILHTNQLVAYSMTVIFILEFFVSLFASFFILKWILQFYLIYLVWEGSKILMEIPEKKLLSYTLVTSFIILVSPVVVEFVFNTLYKIVN